MATWQVGDEPLLHVTHQAAVCLVDGFWGACKGGRKRHFWPDLQICEHFAEWSIAVLVVGTSVWFMSSAGRPTEGSLRVNINTATLTELESIPGIGDKLALLVVAERPYQSVDELVKVRGIAERKLESLRPYVKVDGKTEKLR